MADFQGILGQLMGNQQPSNYDPAQYPVNPNDPSGLYLGNLINENTTGTFQAARNQQGLMGMAAGLLKGGAPQVGVPVTFGSALAEGITGMMAAQNALTPQALQAAQTAHQIADTAITKLQGLGLLNTMDYQRQRLANQSSINNALHPDQGGGEANAANASSLSPLSGVNIAGSSGRGSGATGASSGGVTSLAMLQPPEVQEQVAKNIATTSGLQHWGGVDPNTGKAWNPALRSAFDSAGLPLSGPISEQQWEAAKPLILKLESMGGQNVRNYHFDATHTAGGPFQITNTTWKAFGGPIGQAQGPAPEQGGGPQSQAGGGDINLAEGDSIGVGLQKFGNLPGNPVGGRNPQAVFDNITSNLSVDPNYYKGKTVVLSSGTMNDPRGKMTGLIPQQIDAIQKAGGNVILVGADTGQFAGRNDDLAQIAQRAGVPFAGPLPTDNVHPGPDGYRSYLGNASKFTQQSQPSPAAQPPQPTGPTQSGLMKMANAGSQDTFNLATAGAPPSSMPAPNTLLGAAAAGQPPTTMAQNAQAVGPGASPPPGYAVPPPLTRGNSYPGIPPAVLRQMETDRLLGGFLGDKESPYTPYLNYGPETTKSYEQERQKSLMAPSTAYGTAAGKGAGESTYEYMERTYPDGRGGTITTQVPKAVVAMGPNYEHAFVQNGWPGVNALVQSGVRAGPPVAAPGPQGGATGPQPVPGAPGPVQAPQTPPGAPSVPEVAPGYPQGKPAQAPNAEVNPNANYFPIEVGKGPGQSEPLSINPSQYHPFASELPALSEAVPRRGSNEDIKGQIKANNDTIDSWQKAQEAIPTAENQVGAIWGAMKGFETGKFAGDIAEFTKTLRAAGIRIDPKYVNDPAQAGIIAKDAYNQVLSTLKATGIQRFTQLEVKWGGENFAGTDHLPVTNFNILAQTLGTIEYQKTLIQDWAAAKQQGWNDANDFTRAWQQHNRIQDFENGSKWLYGPLRGMTDPEINQNMPGKVPGYKAFKRDNGLPPYPMPFGSKMPGEQ